jgi:HEPN domain-containing protein
MNNKIENIDKVVQHWIDSADKNRITMDHLIETKDFNWALFLGHLVIEKLLKALYVKQLERHAIFSHDLLRLASKINIEVTAEQEEWLDKITTFNLNARYDNYKMDFYKLCTEDFTLKWLDRIQKLESWLRKQL